MKDTQIDLLHKLKTECMAFITKAEGRILINLEITPGAAKPGLKGYNKWRSRLMVKVHAQAQKGSANAELLTWLTVLLGINKKQISIIKGKNSKLKTVEITDIDYDRVLNKFIEAMNE